MTFAGFPKDLFTFFSQLKKNNNREWFMKNKPRYQEVVVEPMFAFIEAMGERLPEVSDFFLAEPRANGGSMFRIYRDTRFYKGEPYKVHASCQFRHEAGKDVHAPGFYVQLSPDEVMFGGGIWRPPSKELSFIREAIVEQPDVWKKIVSSKKFRDTFGEVQGESLKRPPRGYNADTVHIEYIKMKSFFAIKHSTKEAAMSPAFVDEVAKCFKSVSHLMKFLTEAVELPYEHQ